MKPRSWYVYLVIRGGGAGSLLCTLAPLWGREQAETIAKGIASVWGSRVVIVHAESRDAAERLALDMKVPDAAGVYRANPTLVHHGIAQGASFHVLSTHGAPFADLYFGNETIAKRVAQVIADHYGAPLVLAPNDESGMYGRLSAAESRRRYPLDSPGGMLSAVSRRNPDVRPVTGQRWPVKGGGGTARVGTVRGAFMDYTDHEGNRQYNVQVSQFVATHRAPTGARPNPKRRNPHDGVIRWSEAPRTLGELARTRVHYEGGRFLEGAILSGLSKADRDAIDAYLVRIKHPSAYEPGTQVQRIAAAARELAAQPGGQVTGGQGVYRSGRRGNPGGPDEGYYHGGTLAPDGMVEITRAQYAKVHADHKGKIEGRPTITGREAGRLGGGTALYFVRFVTVNPSRSAGARRLRKRLKEPSRKVRRAHQVQVRTQSHIHGEAAYLQALARERYYAASHKARAARRTPNPKRRNPGTPSDKFERGVFGMSLDEMRSYLEGQVQLTGGWPLLAGSMCSDVQELIAMKRLEEARQLLNRVKWVIFERIERRPNPRRVVDWNAKQYEAKRMTLAELHGALADIRKVLPLADARDRDTGNMNDEGGYYRDVSSVYRGEIAARRPGEGPRANPGGAWKFTGRGARGRRVTVTVEREPVPGAPMQGSSSGGLGQLHYATTTGEPGVGIVLVTGRGLEGWAVTPQASKAAALSAYNNMSGRPSPNPKGRKRANPRTVVACGKRIHNPGCPCDPRCCGSRGPVCECRCRGHNHGGSRYGGGSRPLFNPRTNPTFRVSGTLRAELAGEPVRRAPRRLSAAGAVSPVSYAVAEDSSPSRPALLPASFASPEAPPVKWRARTTRAARGTGRAAAPREETYAIGDRVSVPYMGRLYYFGRKTKRTHDKGVFQGIVDTEQGRRLFVMVQRGKGWEPHYFEPHQVRRLANKARAYQTKRDAVTRLAGRFESKPDQLIAQYVAAQKRFEALQEQAFNPLLDEAEHYRATAAATRAKHRVEQLCAAGAQAQINMHPERAPWPEQAVRNPSSRERAQAEATFRMWHDFAPHHKPKRVAVPSRRIPKHLALLGEVTRIDYKSDKWEGVTRHYTHSTKKPRPVLASSPDRKQLFLVGGKMRPTADGLVN